LSNPAGTIELEFDYRAARLKPHPQGLSVINSRSALFSTHDAKQPVPAEGNAMAEICSAGQYRAAEAGR
jgi:hypothetical protein